MSVFDLNARIITDGSSRPVELQARSKSSVIPLLAEEGWRDSRKADAPGTKREADRAKPQLMVSSAETFRRSDHPVCAFASLGAATPPLRGGEYVASWGIGK